MKGKLNLLLIIVAVALFFLAQCFFIVKEGQVAIKTRVSRIVGNDIQPGLHFKWPLLESKVIFDARLQTLDAEPENVLTKEKKELIVDYFVEWRIADTQKYWVSTRGIRSSAENIIAQIVTDDLRGEFAKRTVHEVVSEDRSEIKWLMYGLNGLSFPIKSKTVFSAVCKLSANVYPTVCVPTVKSRKKPLLPIPTDKYRLLSPMPIVMRK